MNFVCVNSIIVEEAWKPLIESCHPFQMRKMKEADSQFIWVGLLEVVYLSSGLSFVRIFVLITFASSTFSLHALKFLYVCHKELDLRYWFWGNESSPSLWAPCWVGGWYLWYHVEENRTFGALSAEKTSYFTQVKSGGKLEP